MLLRTLAQLTILACGLNGVWGYPASAQAPAAAPAPPFRQVIPFGAMLFYEEARALLKAGQVDEAFAKLQRAIVEFPAFFQARLDLAQELFRRKDLTAATETLLNPTVASE